MIDIKDLKYKYAGSRRYVFSDFNLSMESNNIYGLLGKNGMGKSTLLYLISGLLRRNGGTISINGLDTCATLTSRPTSTSRNLPWARRRRCI